MNPILSVPDFRGKTLPAGLTEAASRIKVIYHQVVQKLRNTYPSWTETDCFPGTDWASFSSARHHYARSHLRFLTEARGRVTAIDIPTGEGSEAALQAKNLLLELIDHYLNLSDQRYYATGYTEVHYRQPVAKSGQDQCPIPESVRLKHWDVPIVLASRGIHGFPLLNLDASKARLDLLAYFGQATFEIEWTPEQCGLGIPAVCDLLLHGGDVQVLSPQNGYLPPPLVLGADELFRMASNWQ